MGFVCPGCGNGKGWELQTKAWTWECAGCGRQTSVTADTIMHHAKLPLTTWFWAAYLMATHSNGISALQLQRQLALGSYKTAWLRRAHAGQARGLKAHGPGRIRLAEVPDYSAQSLHPFIAQNLAVGATAKTDGWSAYPGAPGVSHDPHVIGKMAAHVILPWVHRIFSNLKVWALGVYHGLRRRHLQSYLDEFVFRFNRRHTRHAAFRSLLGIAAGHEPLTYQMLISHRKYGTVCSLQSGGYVCVGNLCA